jgi:hypothetical protein
MAAAAALQAINDGRLECDPVKGLVPINYNVSDEEGFFGNSGSSPFELAQEQGADYYIFLDFCPKAAVIERLVETGNTVTILDHHKTAKEDAASLSGLPGLDLTFDMTKSGAVMAWDFFHGSNEIPELAKYVQDRDLWQWKMNQTREVMAWLSAVAEQNRPETYLSAISIAEVDMEGVTLVGKMLTAEMDSQIARMASGFRYVEFEEFGRGIIVNAGCYQSEVCQYLYDRHPVAFVIAYHSTRGGDVALSIRSKAGAPQSIDVTTLAKTFGGGGHAHAAGGVASLDEWYEVLSGSEHQ